MKMTHKSLFFTVIYIFISFLSYPIFAQNDSINHSEEPLIDDLGRLPESFDMALDTLLNKRYRDYYSLSKHRNKIAADGKNKDRLYRGRIQAMESAIPLTYNPIVRDAIELYINRRSSLLSNMLAKSTYYFPIIEEALDRHNLPLELKYLAIVESALDPTAVSRMGATGLWQFMLRTGKVYGLHIDSLIDERRDPHKSSEAMCKYFVDMYALYGDWLLSIAAYNCGPGNVNKAIRQSGGSRDFWRIYPYLPRETRSYVPFFIAAFYAMEHYKEHDIRPRTIQMPLAVDTIHVNTRQNFQTLSQLTKVNINIIRELNPKYRREVVPGNMGTQIVFLPAPDAIYFSAHKDSILASVKTVEITTRSETISHRVRKGENITAIAKKYGVNLEEIKEWNNLRSNKLRTGQILRIHLDNGDNSNSIDEKDDEFTPEKKVIKQPQKRYHTVRRGETLSSVARKYKGVTVAKIKRANKLKSDRIKPGQKLVIP